MKIGVDAVLLACWASLEYSGNILDVGTGCGVIALICAQRAAQARITAIDSHLPSVLEANANFRLSPWQDRLNAEHIDFEVFLPSQSYDYIISNPPYFNSGISKPDTTRLSARHDDSLSPLKLLEKAGKLLTPQGRLGMIFPYTRLQEILDYARDCNFAPISICYVRGHVDAPIKRVMAEFSSSGNAGGAFLREQELILETSPGVPTDQYRRLCRDLYLKF